MVSRYFLVVSIAITLRVIDGASIFDVHRTQHRHHDASNPALDRSLSLRATPPPPPGMSMALSERTIRATPRRVKLEIHYETLCPYCSELIAKSLQPIWEDKEFREHLDLSMFPAGNVLAIPTTQVSEGYRFFHPEMIEEGFDHVFQCQHGEQECLGNMVQACAMKMLGEPKDYLPFLFCMEEGAAGGDSVEKISFECMQKMDVKAEELVNCTRGPDANTMMYGIANYSNSLSPKRQYVPWVVIDGEHVESADAGNLLEPLCQALASPKPKACDQSGSRGSKGIIGKIGGWLGAMEESRSIVPSQANGSAKFCYP